MPTADWPGDRVAGAGCGRDPLRLHPLDRLLHGVSAAASRSVSDTHREYHSLVKKRYGDCKYVEDHMGMSSSSGKAIVARERQARALDLRKRGWRLQEIADDLGVTEGAVRKMLKNALVETVDAIKNGAD